MSCTDIPRRGVARSHGGRIAVAAALGAVVAMITSVTATAEVVGLTVSPARVPAGGTVTVRGGVLSESPENPNHALACPPSGTVGLSSAAFAGHGTIQAPYSGGQFSIQVTILPQVRPGAYTVTAQCSSTPPAQTTLVVISPGLPVTGAPPVQEPGPEDGARAAALVSGVLAVLLLAAAALRRTGRVRRG